MNQCIIIITKDVLSQIDQCLPVQNKNIVRNRKKCLRLHKIMQFMMMLKEVKKIQQLIQKIEVDYLLNNQTLIQCYANNKLELAHLKKDQMIIFCLDQPRAEYMIAQRNEEKIKMIINIKLFVKQQIIILTFQEKQLTQLRIFNPAQHPQNKKLVFSSYLKAKGQVLPSRNIYLNKIKRGDLSMYKLVVKLFIFVFLLILCFYDRVLIEAVQYFYPIKLKAIQEIQKKWRLIFDNQNKQSCLIKIQIMQKPLNKFRKRFAITFGECSILHIGSQSLGYKAQSGFTLNELINIKNQILQSHNLQSNVVILNEKLDDKIRAQNEAAVLHIPNGVNVLMEDQKFSDMLYQEQDEVQYDQKYFDNRRKRTLNKQARYNIVFGDTQQEPSQDFKTFSIRSFSSLKFLQRIRLMLPACFGKKAEQLNAEGNCYFEEKSGIGFHGDSERKIVICISIGRSSVLRYFWREPGSSQNKYGPFDLQLKHGDIYIMSEKATGHDWRCRSKYRLVHAAGSLKYIGREIKQDENKDKYND